MSGLVDWLQMVYSLMAVLPFIPFLLVWGIVYGFTRDKRIATHRSIDVTALFLIGSVSLVSKRIFQTDFGFWAVVLVLLIVCGLVGSLQNRTKGKVNPWKLAKTLLRFSFIFLSASYILLLCIAIVTYMITS
ncbi:DUF3397 domain-containing protein [Paenibacillus agricola]|uniref:DUF3397 domain-containing protein n=1 Tax=Paenibacillus agricola TaxID=2716264 RepID=A0ABX0J7Q2_9BACL|nr:DUF3397 domain-containing protein [Paenibacillus agricola]NHN30897.1 DUF3397 domain-containing protein [Paenibacillus agricola]